MKLVKINVATGEIIERRDDDPHGVEPGATLTKMVDGSAQEWRWLEYIDERPAPDLADKIVGAAGSAAPTITATEYRVAYAVTSRPIADLRADLANVMVAALKAKLDFGVTVDGHVWQVGVDKFGMSGLATIHAKAFEADLALRGIGAWPENFEFRDKANNGVALSAEAMITLARNVSAKVTALRLFGWGFLPEIAAADRATLLLSLKTPTAEGAINCTALADWPS